MPGYLQGLFWIPEHNPEQCQPGLKEQKSSPEEPLLNSYQRNQKKFCWKGRRNLKFYTVLAGKKYLNEKR